MRTFLLLAMTVAVPAVTMSSVSAQRQNKPPLASADIDAIAQLLMLEDTRTLDQTVFEAVIGSAHPEVRRRAAMALGRIAKPEGIGLVGQFRDDPDPEVAASAAFAYGQLKLEDAVRWLGDRLIDPTTPPVVAREAARSLGKIRTSSARAPLARYLGGAVATETSVPVIGEALLALGRFTAREDLSPIVRWTTARESELRWRAAWALFRPRDPAAVPHLLTLTRDRSADVRFWAVRGLVPPTAPSRAGGAAPMEGAAQEAVAFDRAAAAARLREAVRDGDRRVKTEALRALAMHDDDASFAVVLAALESRDTWLSVSAAEAMSRFTTRAAAVIPALTAAVAPGRPLSLRVTAIALLSTLAPEAALEPATALAKEPGTVARAAGRSALGRLGDAGRARLAELGVEVPAAGRGRAGGGGAPAAPPAPARPLAEYRALVERWIVPDYLGAPKPRSIWETPHGRIEIELYPGESPLGVEHFIELVTSGDIVGTEFGRVVPNFVAQQQTVRNARRLRDEVSRLGLTRGNLSWASSGLDTGRPGYTLAVTPQPHNEGDFTALGRIIRGMDVVDRLELGDAITAAKMR
jgi:HEAT repeat protein/cyclophilin family peptidyl-prolyl cis-trans isomerase